MIDAFNRLGLPRRFLLTDADLERVYLAHSRAVHPDYHITGSSGDLSASLDLSAAVNEAYNILRDPFLRAEHLLILAGGPSAVEQKQMPPAFLAEMLDAREEIEQARGNPAETERLEATFTRRFDTLLSDVGGLFQKLDELPPDDASRVPLMSRVRSLLNAAKYVRGLIHDLNTSG